MGDLSVAVPDLLRRHGKDRLIEHVSRVAATARRTAQAVDVDAAAAEAAGWLHDISLILPGTMRSATFWPGPGRGGSGCR